MPRLKWDDGAGCEVLADGRQFVSLMIVDATGDNTLVYLSKRRAKALAGALLDAAVTLLPSSTKAKKKRKAKR